MSVLFFNVPTSTSRRPSSKEKGRGFEVRMVDYKGLEERYNTLLNESLNKNK